jgi:hypothetical protein
MAGFFNADLIIFTSLKEGIRRIKDSLYLVDSINGLLVEDQLLADLYGKQEVDRFRKFVDKTYINVVLDHRPPEQAKYPCISVGIGQGAEEPQQKLALGDGHDTITVDPNSLQGLKVTPKTLVGPVTPESYDKMTGTLVLPDSVSLKDVYQGMVVLDEVNNTSYDIEMVIDNQTLMITPDSTPNLNGMTIRPRSKLVGNTRKSVYCRENYDLTVVATDPTELLYVFNLTMLILLRFKKELFELRGFDVQTFNYGPIMNGDDGSPNKIWFRTISLSGRVEYQWSNEISEQIEGLKVDLRVTNTDGDDLKSPDGVLAQVQAQGWSEPGDPDAE